MLDKFAQGEKPFKDPNFRKKLNDIVDEVNGLSNKVKDAVPPLIEIDDGEGGADGGTERWIKITGHTDDTGRTWLYNWQECEPDGEGGWLLGPINQDTILIPDGSIPYGQAKNGAEEISGLTLTRPIKTGAIVRARITIRKDEEDNPVPRVVFSSTNTERQFFAEITGFSDGYYSWVEVYPDGTAVGAGDEPQSGSNAVNSYYGPDDLTHVVSNGKVVLMEHLPSDVIPDLVGFCVPLEGDSKPMVGDEMGYPAPATIPEVYPPYAPADNPVQIGGDGAWIEVWEVDDPDSVTDPKERIQRIYHLEPSTAATGADFNTCLADVTDGGDPDGGGSGSISFEDVKVAPDAMGHIFSSEPELTPSSLSAGVGLVINGSLKTGTIKHSNPGAVVNSFGLNTASVAGGASVTFPAFDTDALGHTIPNPAGNNSVDFIGDDWIDFADGGGNEINVTHSVAQSDGALSTPDPTVTVVSGTAAGTGGIEIDVVNPYVDSKGHVKASSTTVSQAAILAGNKLKITGSDGTATVQFVDATAGSPTLVDNVVTDLAFAIVGSNLRITMTKKPLNKTVDSYGNVTDVSTGTATTSDLDVPIGAC